MKVLWVSLFAISTLLTLNYPATAASGSVIHTFQGSSGQNPLGLAVDSNGNLFGTTLTPSNQEVVYELSPLPGGDWSYQILYEFSDSGANGAALLPDEAGNLFGVTYSGGAHNLGRVFELSPGTGDAWTLNTLYDFGAYPTDGANPSAGLTFDASGDLYGTTMKGGSAGQGTVFELAPDGMGGWSEELLYQFQGKPDGAWPSSPLTFDASGNILGTTNGGGSGSAVQCIFNQFNGCGTVFELTPSAGGWSEAVLHNFDGGDGQWPITGVTLDSAGNLFGTTIAGGAGSRCMAGCGVAYGLTAQGLIFNVLNTFNGKNGAGFTPSSGLILTRGNYYGTTDSGGIHGGGTAYRIMRTDSGFHTTVLYNFTGGKDGASPKSLVLNSAGDFYGVTFYGGNAQLGDGTVFEGVLH